MKNFMATFFFLICISWVSAQCIFGSEFSKNHPKKDLRGVFLTTVFNIDWPTNNLATPAVQQAELIAILDNLRANNYNTVFVQVRPECDAIYNSTIEPWSYRLTGTQGLAPNPLWDPLAFAIAEAHLRGLDLHAWINPFRVRSNINEYGASTGSVLSVLTTQPSWVFTASNNANLKILNPGIPAVQEYIKSIVVDIATRYDVDGIHFDDYFYPNAGMGTNQDSATFATNNPTNIATIDDWRRNNVNGFIAKIFDAIATININLNKNIVFGVSPAGIWKSGTPGRISGNPSFSALFCDPISWLKAGKVDYLAPQTYWKITGTQDYVSLSKWWNDQVKSKNKQLYLSQAYYRMTDSSNWSGIEIQNQISNNRVQSMDATFGQIAYNYSSIKNNDKGINTLLNAAQFRYKSFAPPIFGKDTICPNAPLNIIIDGTNLKWTTPALAIDGDLPTKYVVYAFDSPSQAITNKDDGSKIINILAGNQMNLTQNQLDTKCFVVSSLDKNNNENGVFSQTTTLFNTNFSSENLFEVYPNPFDSKFEVTNNDISTNIVSIRLYDLSGKMVWAHKNDLESTIVVDVATIESGFYIGKIFYKNKKSNTFKIIKK